jgi:phosphoribosylanthranilate isomerase
LGIQLGIKIKFCGITNSEDANYASDLGADALGFVFYSQSPRFVSLDKARKIIDKLPPFITSVGLFVNPTEAEVLDVINECRINLLQFHGDEDESFCTKFNLPYIKAIPMKPHVNLLKFCDDYSTAKALLLDTYSTDLRGGTGKTFDWKLIPLNTSKPIIIAGGLNPQNIKNLLESIRPYGVDVSGGIESIKGKKDHQLMNEFITGVINAGV